MNSADDLTSFFIALGLVLLIAICVTITLLLLGLAFFLFIYVIFECVLRPILPRCHDVDLEVGRRVHRPRIVTYHAVIPDNLRSQPGIFDGGDLHLPETGEKRGLLENAIEKLLPRLLVTHGSDERSVSSSIECAICLCDYLAGDECRVFPICNHKYHADCIDLWLKDHLTCPVCRKGLLDS